MKKLLILLSVTMMLSVSIFSLVACGESEHVHDFTNGDCVCGEKKSSEDLQYVISDDGEYYILTGRGICSDKDVVIPSQYKEKPVKEIKASSFSGDILRSITISNSIISIGSSAFYNCSSLESVEIGDSVTSIGESAFYNCNSLTSVEIPDSVTSIGSSAFSGCPIEKATIPAIACSSVNNDSLQEVIITSGDSIGERAFYGCSSFTSVEIGDSVTSIGDEAFYKCSSLTKVNYKGTIDEWAQIEFENSTSNPLSYAKNLYINNVLITEAKITTSTKISNYAFYNCDSLTSVEIGDSVTSIGRYAFRKCSSLTSVEIPDSVTSIGSYAFYNCTSLQYNVRNGLKYLGNQKNKYVYLSDTESDEIISANIETDCKFIGSSAFEDCSSLESVEISDSVTSIGSSAFYGCNSLTKVNYKGTIDEWAQIEFEGSTSNPLNDEWPLIEVEGSTSNPLYYAKKLYINNVLITEAKITTSTKISNYAFYNCKSLTSVEISDSVTSIGSSAFSGCPIEKATIPAIACSSVNNDSLKEVIITSGDSIGYEAFEGCYSLISIEIPDSVTSIGAWAFWYCSSLTSVEIPDSVTSIGYYAFSGCSLTSIEIPDSVTSIGGNAFANCDSLTKVNYKGTIDEWAQIEFEGYDSNPLSYAKNLYINNVLITEAKLTTSTKISNYAFYNCSSLTSVEISDSVTSIGKSAFGGCDSLTSIEIPDSVTSIGERAFSYCDSLTSIEIGDSVTSIGEEAFYYCDSLTSIEIGDSVTSIGEDAFYNCKSITSITFNGTVEEWNAIEKERYWSNRVPATYVECSNGKVNIK